MARALDHFVLGVTDLEVAGAMFSALGFRVGAVNRHPWGTENRIIQFSDETFFELIAVGNGAAIPPHAPHHFSFGAFVRDALMRKTGLSMLVLKSADARADAAYFAEAGIGDFAPFDFARKGTRPDGTPVEVAFTLAFARDAAAPDCGFFVCQQHFPENFWSLAMQQHDNGARGIARISLVAENPSDHHIFLGAFTGNREMRATSTGIESVAGQGVIEIVTPEGFAFRYGVPAPEARTPQFAGLEIRVPEASRIDIFARAAASPCRIHAGGAVLPASSAFATVLRFVSGDGSP